MNRLLLSIALSLCAAPAVAWAQNAAPTKDELAAAKKAFDEGNALYKAGKLAEAVEMLKESYRLSRNAFLLYNIGRVYDQLGQKDMVLFYYKKFLQDAPANAQMRPDVQKRVTEIEQESTAPAEPEKPEEEVTQPESGKPQIDFKHELIMAAPPGKPLDVGASVPKDANVKLTLFYRGSGDAKFTPRLMVWRENELVGHIPASKMFGNSVQYYIEVRDNSDKLLTRSGKATNPNLVAIERDAPPRSYPDLVEESDKNVVKPLEDPLSSQMMFGVQTEEPVDTGPPFSKAKWISTGVAVVIFGGSLTSYLIAKNQHDALVADAHSCGTPPCREFDAEFGQVVEERGLRYNTIYKVTLGLGFGAAAVAGYFWYRNLTAKPKPTDASAWIIAPSVDQGFAGATAAARF